MKYLSMALFGACAVGSLTYTAWGTEVQIDAGKDNTIFESETGSLSNGEGPNLFIGKSGGITPPQIKRALLWFDIAGAVPAGSTITGVTLRLRLLQTIDSTSRAAELRRALQNWGEGESNAGSPGGGGAQAMPGDATWLHTFFDTDFWVNPGGDFSATVSAAQSVGTGVGNVTWGSTAQMVADVQSWLDDPNSNCGWLMMTDESVIQTARRFGSRENTTAANHPLLTIDYIPIADLDDNGVVDLVDFALLAVEMGATDCSALNNWCNRADMAPVGSPDGMVDGTDVREFSVHWLN